MALDIFNPSVIITNIDLVIIWAILENYLLIFYLLYLWYLNKNIIVNCKKLFNNEVS